MQVSCPKGFHLRVYVRDNIKCLCDWVLNIYDLLVICAQVIVGTFVLDNKKDGSGKGDASGSKFPSPVKASVPSFGFLSPVESSVRNPARGNDDHLTIGGGNPFSMQPSSMHLLSARSMDWRSSPDVRTTAGFDFTGKYTRRPPPSSYSWTHQMTWDVFLFQEDQFMEYPNLQ